MFITTLLKPQTIYNRKRRQLFCSYLMLPSLTGLVKGASRLHWTVTKQMFGNVGVTKQFVIQVQELQSQIKNTSLKGDQTCIWCVVESLWLALYTNILSKSLMELDQFFFYIREPVIQPLKSSTSHYKSCQGDPIYENFWN